MSFAEGGWVTGPEGADSIPYVLAESELVFFADGRVKCFRGGVLVDAGEIDSGFLKRSVEVFRQAVTKPQP